MVMSLKGPMDFNSKDNSNVCKEIELLVEEDYFVVIIFIDCCIYEIKFAKNTIF